MRTRSLPGLALLLLAALPAPGQEEPPQEPARFLIEKVTVEGSKEAAANIVRAESLLREGESYTEDELRQAIYRVHRLPFVLDASFSLRKGSERGTYELLIEVQPTRWFFFDHWLRAFRFDEPLDLEDDTFESDSSLSSLAIGGVVGTRLFVGRSGVLFAALNSQDGIEAGFTQYDLFHRGILASASVSWNDCCVQEVLPLALDPTFSSWSFGNSRKISLGASVPLGGRQSIQASLSERRGARGNRDEVLGGAGELFNSSFVRGQDLSYRRAEAKWVYDTTDDPLFPTRGLSLSAGLEASHLRIRDLVSFSLVDPSLPNELTETPFSSSEAEQVVGALSAIRHWSLSPRQTVSASGRFSLGRSRLENLVTGDGRILPQVHTDFTGGSLGLQYAAVLKHSRGEGNFTDLRLETGFEAGVETTSPDLGVSPLERFSVFAAVVFRNQWGRIRVSLTYLDLGEVLP